MNKLTYALASLLLVLGLSFVSTVGFGQVALATAASEIIDGQAATGQDGDLKAFILNITNLLLFVLGAIAVIVIIIGGIKYTTSDGDSAKIKSAKDTILYAIVGIVVALLAYAIVHFVISSIKS